MGGGRPYRGRWIKVGPAGKAEGGLKQEEEGDPGGGTVGMWKVWLGRDAWSRFAGVEGLCEAKMLKVYLVWTLGLVEMPAGTKGCERAVWGSNHCSVFIYCNS